MDNKIKAYCNSCRTETNHVVHGKFELHDKEEDEIHRYSIVQCLGCDSTSFLHKWAAPEDIDREDDVVYYEEQFPKDPDRFPAYEYLSHEDQEELPSILYYLYDELKVVLENDADTLAGVGLRMVVEGVCVHKKIAGRNLKSRIDKILEMGLISINDHEIIDALREIGNISAHKIKSPSASDLEASLEAVNHLLRTLYIVQNRTKKLRKKS
ncbi:MAG: DUF4145 domain-containing protein [Reichenbachiella sp.]|uniref:DUF4145 domain-containing protein n=1 Tax=Reichenbachiella sp. TaxID=2184521 RepID=UPI003266DD15